MNHFYKHMMIHFRMSCNHKTFQIKKYISSQIMNLSINLMLVATQNNLLNTFKRLHMKHLKIKVIIIINIKSTSNA